MCAVSQIHMWAKQNIPLDQWSRITFTEYQDIIRRIQELDDKLNQKECVDPSKAAWMKDVEKRLSKLERKGNKLK